MDLPRTKKAFDDYNQNLFQKNPLPGKCESATFIHFHDGTLLFVDHRKPGYLILGKVPPKFFLKFMVPFIVRGAIQEALDLLKTEEK